MSEAFLLFPFFRFYNILYQFCVVVLFYFEARVNFSAYMKGRLFKSISLLFSFRFVVGFVRPVSSSWFGEIFETLSLVLEACNLISPLILFLFYVIALIDTCRKKEKKDRNQLKSKIR